MAKVNDTDKHHQRSDCSIFPHTHANITNCVRLWPGFLPACFEELSAGWRGPWGLMTAEVGMLLCRSKLQGIQAASTNKVEQEP